MAFGDALGFTGLGQKLATGDNLALFLRVFGGEVYTTYEQNNTTGGLFIEQSISGGKESQEQFIGDVVAVESPRGTNVIADSGASQLQKNKKLEKIIRLDEMIRLPQVIPEIDLLMSPAGAQERMRIAQKQGQSLAYSVDLRRISTLLQTAALPDHNLGGAVLTKTTAGDSSHANISDGVCGLHVDSTLATPDGANIESILFKFQDFFDFLNIPQAGRFCLIRPQYMRAIVKGSGRATTAVVDHAGANTITTVNSPSKSLDADFGGAGNGSYRMGIVYECAGFRLISSPHLAKFGTLIQSYFGDPAAAGSKYMPGSTYTDTIAGINGVTQPNGGGGTGAFEQNAAGNNPDDWNAAGHNTQIAFDAVCFICGYEDACKTRILKPVTTMGDWKSELVSYLVQSYYVMGHGAVRPEAVVYAASAKG